MNAFLSVDIYRHYLVQLFVKVVFIQYCRFNYHIIAILSLCPSFELPHHSGVDKTVELRELLFVVEDNLGNLPLVDLSGIREDLVTQQSAYLLKKKRVVIVLPGFIVGDKTGNANLSEDIHHGALAASYTSCKSN